MKINKIHLAVLIGLILVNLALYFINLNDFFVSDDFDWLYNTQTSQHSLSDYFSANYYGQKGVGGTYRPMFNVIFKLNYNLSGLNPLGYHLFSLIFHIGVCFLIYLLVLALFDQDKQKPKIAILAAFFFAILPNHSEAVIWIAAIGDPVVSFFYLLAFYLYIVYRQKKSFMALIVSLVSFIFALLTKEMAITLPLLILVWELYQGLAKNKIILSKIIFHHLGYWLLLLLYFVIRYAAIGLFWGYYATEKFKLEFGKIFAMIAALSSDLLFYGSWRVALTNYFIQHKLFFVLLIIFIVTIILYILRSKFFKAAFLIDAYIILILPVILLGYNAFNDEGERYNYLPSVMFCILLSLLIWQFFDLLKAKYQWLAYIGLLLLILYFSGFLINKNYNWQIASQLSRKIIQHDFTETVDFEKQEKILFVALPDNFEGAQVLRNGIRQAINLYYPNYDLQAEVLNVYLRLTTDIKDEKILYWGPYPTGGYLAETFDQGNWVTGFATGSTEQYTYELWGYDYDNYTTNQIRLILKDETGNFIPAGQEQVNIVTYNQGKLQILK